MPDQPTHRTAHEAHDAELIAAFADDGLTATERAKATELVATCPECAELLTDLRSIMAATSALPVPARTRDFRLTEEDARRLRPGGWRQLIGFLAGPRLAFTQPLAAGLTTLGLAGLLLFSLQGFTSLGSSASAPLSKAGNPVPQAAASSQPTSQPGPAAAPAAGGVPAPSGSPTRVAGEFSNNSPSPAASAAPSSATDARNSASGPPATDSGAGTGNSGGASSEGGPNMQAFGSEQGRGLPPLVFISGLAILVGLGLFLLRWTARRLSEA